MTNSCLLIILADEMGLGKVCSKSTCQSQNDSCLT